VPAARVDLPPPLARQTPEPVQGIGLGRQGEFTIGDARGRFQRGRDRVELFERVSFDRARTRYALTLADGRQQQAACRGRELEVSWRVLAAAARPYRIECEFSGAVGARGSARLQLDAPGVPAVGRSERRGQFIVDGQALEIASLHRVEGSPLPLEAPIGYLFSHAGQPVGAVELNGPAPRLWRPAAGSALHEPVTLAALALALLWDPAQGMP
jgi:hypothetical protein